MRSPRTDPAAAELAIEQPAPRTQRHPREPDEQCTFCTCCTSPSVPSCTISAQERTRLVVAELEVAQRDHHPRPAPRRPDPPPRRHRARTACRTAPALPASSAMRTCGACRNGGECTLTRSTSARAATARTASSSRAETTSTTSQPSVAANTGATTRRPNPVPMTATFIRRASRVRRRARGDGTGACPSVRRGPDREGEQHGSDADVAAEQEPDHEDGAFHGRADDPEPVARARLIAVIRPSLRPGTEPATDCRARHRRRTSPARGTGAGCAPPARCCSGMRYRPRLAMKPIESVLTTVPMPKRWRSGIHASSTTSPVNTTTTPNDKPVASAMPWWNTSHGATPSWARTDTAIANPSTNNPSTSGRESSPELGCVRPREDARVLRVVVRRRRAHSTPDAESASR